MRAAQSFYDDLTKYGLKRAQLNAKRQGQRSRLRVMNKETWWNEFIEFAFQERVGREEEKFIERIARCSRLKVMEYYEILRELEAKGEASSRSILLLKWLNTKCHYVDDQMIDILRASDARTRRQTGPRLT